MLRKYEQIINSKILALTERIHNITGFKKNYSKFVEIKQIPARDKVERAAEV